MQRTSLVLLPSQLCTDLLWQNQIDAFRTFADPTVIVLDEHDTMAALASDVLARMPEQFMLCAHGMGGFVAFEILRRAPERVTKLALLSTLAPADTPKQTARREGYLRLVEQGKFDGIIEERIPALLHPSSRNDSQLTGILRQMARETGPAGFLNQQRAIMAREDSTPSLGAIACETLILFGRADGITTFEHQSQLKENIARSRLEVVEDAGHMMMLERPKAVTTLLSEFFGGGQALACGGITAS